MSWVTGSSFVLRGACPGWTSSPSRRVPRRVRWRSSRPAVPNGVSTTSRSTRCCPGRGARSARSAPRSASPGSASLLAPAPAARHRQRLDHARRRADRPRRRARLRGEELGLALRRPLVVGTGPPRLRRRLLRRRSHARRRPDRGRRRGRQRGAALLATAVASERRHRTGRTGGSAREARATPSSSRPRPTPPTPTSSPSPSRPSAARSCAPAST